MKEILDVLKEINMRLSNFETLLGMYRLDDNAPRLTEEQRKDIKNKWNKYKKYI